MIRFPFKLDDRYIYRYEVATVTVMEMETATAWAPSLTGPSTVIDVYGLRWDYSDGWWHEWHFSNRRVRR